ncbi:SRS domain-containing protein [Neospora caninum Liverpool]|uniref:SRS domain-containing protein n=1 Tax=Neospora caninum (strain Liverpool) TaxID=572307 RepID=F0VDE4_NEOCL|nr:SRS domain-containing protein [Neospora caninum Liverpool]CBZ51659.1 SRS domain-containing protein [Neospora caninum Liverpool]CEL65613.1 TPA: SRS domain-containing protein [Neospora caninum Liverpool]|eukprot:XP_003881692.1 SRS domain-containing protein [Neospora caninum Liverpool]
MASYKGERSPGLPYAGFNLCFFLIFLCIFCLPVVAQDVVNQCAAETPVLSIPVTDTTAVEFKCAAQVTNLYPQYSASVPQKVCESSACTSEVQLKIPNATLGQTDDKYTFTVSQASEEASTVYFKCSSVAPAIQNLRDTITKEDNGEKKCTVQIAVWGPPIQGLPEYPTPSKCAANQSTLNLEVNSSNKSVTFACGDGNVLSPALFDNVFSAEGCTEESPLADHLSTASLVQHGTTEAGKDAKKPAYTFQVTSLPAEEKTVCYQCRKSSPSGRSNDPTCTVYIKVAKEETDSGSTTTAPPDASGAETGRWSCLTLITSLISVSVLLAKMI